MTEPAMLADRAQHALADDFLRKAVRRTVDRLRNSKVDETAAFGRWEDWRERARQIRKHTIDHLDFYLDQFRQNLELAGGQVSFAADAQEAVQLCLDIAQRAGARTVVKSKSMVTEELHLNQHLNAAGIASLETDLGEWIIQLAGEMPSHIILPAIHKNREQIRDLFEKEGGGSLSTDTEELTGYARRRLREQFLAADLGISGCNFAIADTGSVALFTNEGNGRMVTTAPRTHIVMMGMERIVPSWEDLEVMANILPRSATGQKITSYMNVMTGPRCEGEADGPEEMHVIVLDNGRSRQLGDPEFQDILNCIRCGACLNVCPVYRQIGGHAYGSVYPGPIGAVLTPLLAPGEAPAAELANASSLCGACTEACPVKIPLHDMLVHLRRRTVERGPRPLAERLAFKGFGRVFSSPRLYALAGKVGRYLQRQGYSGPVEGWTRYRELPVPPKRAFRDLWQELEKEE